MIMSENKGDLAVTNPQPPLEAAPPAYPMPQYAPTPVPVAASPPAPVPLDPAAAAAIGQQYRDQCEIDTSRFYKSRDNLLEIPVFAQCAAGNHERMTTYGIGGIIAAIVSRPRPSSSCLTRLVLGLLPLWLNMFIVCQLS